MSTRSAAAGLLVDLMELQSALLNEALGSRSTVSEVRSMAVECTSTAAVYCHHYSGTLIGCVKCSSVFGHALRHFLKISLTDSWQLLPQELPSAPRRPQLAYHFCCGSTVVLAPSCCWYAFACDCTKWTGSLSCDWGLHCLLFAP